MLRDARDNPPRTDPMTPIARALTAAALGAAVLAVAGLRGPAPARAQPPGPRAKVVADVAARADVDDKQQAGDPFDLSHAPADTSLAVVGRPAQLLTRPEFAPVAELMNRQDARPGSINLPADQVETVTVLVVGGPAEGAPRGWVTPTIILRTTKPQDWKAVAGKFVGDPEEVRFAGQAYVRTKRSPVGAGYFSPDDRTLVTGPEDALREVIAARRGRPIRHVWDDAWSRVDKGQLAVAVDPRWLKSQMPPRPGGDPQVANLLGALAPLLDQATGYAVGVELEKGLAFDLAATCESDKAAEQVEETLGAVVTLGKNAVRSLRQQVADGPPQGREVGRRLLDLAEPLLSGARGRREPGGQVVRLRSQTDLNAASVMRSMMPAVVAARGAAHRTQSVNNLKQIGIAMHNYHDTYRHFPAAVGFSPDGKVPYSWRVALLPYLEQNELYKQYDFTQTWDSPRNRKVLERMPAVYRHPLDEGSPSRAASYFVLIGPETAFPPGKSGAAVSDFHDGTSNTILVVEAKRDIPWTKPEDIPYDPKRPLPVLGGFTPGSFNIGFADGSVHILSERLPEQVLRAVITKAGGEVVSADALISDPSRPAPPGPTPTRRTPF